MRRPILLTMSEQTLRTRTSHLGKPSAVRRFALPLIVTAAFASTPAAIAQSHADSLTLAALLSDTLARELARHQENEGVIVELPEPPAGTSWRAPPGGRGGRGLSIVVTPAPLPRVENPRWRALVLRALMDRHPEAMRPPVDSALAAHASVRGIRFIGDTAVATVDWSGCIRRMQGGGLTWLHSVGYRLVRTPDGWAFDRRAPGISMHGSCAVPPSRPFVIDSAVAPNIVFAIPAPPPGDRSPQIVDLVREPSGGIYVAITGRAVARFSPDGAPLGELTDSTGRSAIGDRLTWARDTLWVTEAGAPGPDSPPAWLLFDRGGRFLGKRTFPDPEPGVERIRPQRPLGNGVVIGLRSRLPDSVGNASPAIVIAEGHRVVRSVIAVPLLEPKLVTIRDPWTGATREILPPFRDQLMTSIPHDGTRIVWALAIQPRILDRVGIFVGREALSGGPIGPVLQTSDALPVTERGRVAFVDSLASDLAARAGRPVTDEARATIRASLTFPEFHAPATHVLAGEDGSTWIRLPTEGPAAIWLHVDPNGRERRRVPLPADFRGLYADAEDLWGSERSATGLAAQLVRYIGLARPR